MKRIEALPSPALDGHSPAKHSGILGMEGWNSATLKEVDSIDLPLYLSVAPGKFTKEEQVLQGSLVSLIKPPRHFW